MIRDRAYFAERRLAKRGGTPSRRQLQLEARATGKSLCARCDQLKPLTEFHGQARKEKRNGVGYCIRCSKIRKLIKRYELSSAEAEDLLARLETAKCQVCGNPALDVDHDHSTNCYRGLLCRRCNLGIGYFLDSPQLLRAAVVYLEQANGTYS